MQNNQNIELHKKFQRKQTFYQQMQGISKKFFQFQQQIYYSPIKLNPNMIIKIQGKQQNKRIFLKREDFFIINGQEQPRGDRSYQRLILQIVQAIPRPKKSYGIIYINTLAPEDAHNDFTKVMELLPIQFFSNLTKIYVLNASFLSKAFSWLSFGTITNYIKNKTVNVDNLHELAKHTHFQYDFLKKKLPQNVIEQLQKTQIQTQSCMNVQMTQSQFLPQSKSYHQIANIEKNPNQNFSKSVHVQSKSGKKDITEYQLGPSGAPKFLQLLIYFFKNKEQSLKLEGIFRKSVSIDDQTQILHELQNKNYNYIEGVTNPHIIANAMKRFLSNLKVPIISYQLFNIFMQKEVSPTLNQIVIQSIKSLPKVNKMTIFLLFSFLQKIILYSESNKMGENNVCIVFGPCLMRSEVSSIKDLLYAQKTIHITSIIYREFQTIFGNVNSRNLIKRNSYMDYRKEEFQQKNKIQSPKKPQKQLETIQEEGKILDKTSEFIRVSLQDQRKNNYLQVKKVEKAIKNLPKTQQSPLKSSLNIVQIRLTSQEQTFSPIRNDKIKKTSEFTEI